MIPLLLLLLVCSGMALSLVRIVTQETEYMRETIRLRQLETIVQSFMRTALRQEDRTGITETVYQTEPLFPGKEPVNIRVAVHRDHSVGLRFLQVTAEDSRKNEFALRQCRVDFPETLIQSVLRNSFALAGGAEQGGPEEEDGSVTSTSDGAVFPQFSAEEIAVWASTGFPTALELQRDGLSGWMYYSRDRVSLPKGLTVQGSGIFLFADDAVFADNSVFTDRIIVLADRNLNIGSNVRLEKALLLCQGKLTVGTGSFINGAVLARQPVNLGNQTVITVDREVLEPFHSIISY